MQESTWPELLRHINKLSRDAAITEKVMKSPQMTHRMRATLLALLARNSRGIASLAQQMAEKANLEDDRSGGKP